MPRIHATIVGLTIFDDASGLVTFGSIPGTPATLAVAASTFAVGCILVDANTGLEYQNVGTVAIPSWRNSQGSVNQATRSATVATTSNTDDYLTVAETGVLSSASFGGVDALAANDSNYITFSITNLGQAGAGSTAMLAATDANTTKATGGTALAANTTRNLTLNATAANLAVTAGDRLRLRAAATGTLANTVTFPTWMLRFAATA
jgi:hypothetical protein